MELPKNITQIGQSDSRCKIYVEDYVISYLKQLNFPAQNKDIAVALFGKRQVEKDITYTFFYGACKLDFLQRETRHLSQAQQQEIEKLRKKYFPEYELQGYRILNGEMIEGFHIYDQGICRYINGYAQFYEKNDSMLAYMLDTRKEQAEPEKVPQEKYEEARQRQEERRIQAEEAAGRKVWERPAGSGRRETPPRKARPANTVIKPIKRMRAAIASVFVVLCLAGLATMGDGAGIENLRAAADRAVDKLKEQQIPDAMTVAGGNVQSDTLVAEDKLTQALLQENAEASGNGVKPDGTPASGSPVESSVPTETAPAESMEPVKPTEPMDSPEPAESANPSGTQDPAQPEEQQGSTQTEQGIAASAPVQEPVSYVVRKGDTLIAISTSRYGTDKKVQEICALNGIDDPDDIKVGEKILLP